MLGVGHAKTLRNAYGGTIGAFTMFLLSATIKQPPLFSFAVHHACNHVTHPFDSPRLFLAVDKKKERRNIALRARNTVRERCRGSVCELEVCPRNRIVM